MHLTHDRAFDRDCGLQEARRSYFAEHITGETEVSDDNRWRHVYKLHESID